MLQVFSLSPFRSSYEYNLVGGFNHLEKYESQWEGLSHMEKKCSKPPTNNTWHNYMILHVSLHLVLPIYKISKPPIGTRSGQRRVGMRQANLHRLLHCHHICKPMRQNELEPWIGRLLDNLFTDIWTDSSNGRNIRTFSPEPDIAAAWCSCEPPPNSLAGRSSRIFRGFYEKP